MSTSKKLKSEQLFVRVETVMHDLQISRPFAYRMIAGWNEELKGQGYTTICGRIPKAYYEKKIYGMTKEQNSPPSAKEELLESADIYFV